MSEKKNQEMLYVYYFNFEQFKIVNSNIAKHEHFKESRVINVLNYLIVNYCCIIYR